MTGSALDKVIFFDGICNLCNAAVQFIIRHERKNELRFCSLQSSIADEIFKAHSLQRPEVDSILFLEKGVLYTQSEAALNITKYLDKPYNWLFYLRIFPQWLRDAVYRLIARNRFRWFGKRAACMVPTPELRARFIVDEL